MQRTTPDVDTVTALIDEVVQTLVLPKFSRLSMGDIEPKSTPLDPDDVVTIVDRQVEERLSRTLAELVPSAAVIGEEAVHRRPELLRLVASDGPLWIIDPIDGTKNFAAGHDSFGVMLAWVMGGRTQAAWIALPARRQSFVAEAGGGAFLNGERVRVPPQFSDGLARGSLLVRYMPEALREAVTENTRGCFRLIPSSGCAAVEYTGILRGERDFVVYYRLLPWDHAAPTLILREAGGCVAHLDGRAYSVRSENQLTIVARHTSIADQVRARLDPQVGS